MTLKAKMTFAQITCYDDLGLSAQIGALSSSLYCCSKDDVKIHQGGTFTEVIIPSANTGIEAKKSWILTPNNPAVNILYYCMVGKYYESDCILFHNGCKLFNNTMPGGCPKEDIEG